MENNNSTELYIREFKGIVLKLQNDFGFIWSRDLGRVFFHVDALHSRIIPRLYLGDGVIIKVRSQEVKKDCHYRAVSVKRRKWWPDNAMQIYPNHQAEGKPYDDNQIQVKVAAVVGSVWGDRAILWSDQLGRLYFPFKNQPEGTMEQMQSKQLVQVTCHHIRPKVEDCHWEVSAINFSSKSIAAPTEYKTTVARLHNAWRHWEVILKEEKVGGAAKENTFYMGLPDYFESVQSLIDVTAAHQLFEVLVAPTQIHVTTNWRAFFARPADFNNTSNDYAVGHETSSLLRPRPTSPTASRVHILTRSKSQDDTKQVEAKFRFLEEELSQLWHDTSDDPISQPNATWTPVSAPVTPLASPKSEDLLNDSDSTTTHSPVSTSTDLSECDPLSCQEQLRTAKELLKEIVDDKEFFEKLCTKPQLVRRVTMFVFNNV